ncbi:succinylglutamate desuccinylase/aspartoacylase family protein [Neiella sp. HB171785]|uniref:Succinylglutamate desuccinylase/aspartoacylase family protein n=1 Tax=Neiella litorisoli TaxID=2771431 RepID=A0A8J6UPR7_9GAMM|nr:succinylglutamate desuccinylase/aspartoacylase family protein [Neiella litorisoli]MBD1389297.1 succinylglutamate desuccinylase/aspartoacylase family protein [Neiella litorisoli]
MNSLESMLVWHDPKPDEVAQCADSFLQQLQQPTLIVQQGRDTSRTRLFVTLLHGNEPSGLMAILRWLQSGQQPAVTCYFFIGAVEAARHEPHFSVRHFAEVRDLNRCFYGPFDDVPGKIAAQLLALMAEIKPEAVLDVHNTSGSGPSFAVSFSDCPKHIALASLFTERLLLTETKLGALMELTTAQRPIVTIECGGAIDPQSARVAWEGLQRFVSQSQVLVEPPHDWNMEVLSDPLRITLTSEATIAYAEQPCQDADITLPPDVEHFNFGRLQPGTSLAHLKTAGLNCIVATDAAGRDRTNELFAVSQHHLLNRVGLKLFMITSNPIIAKSDCLCYAVIDNAP